MSGVNRVIILGRLGKDVEIRQTQTGKQVASFSVATSEFFKDQIGQKQEKTEWHNIVLWNKLAELAGQYLKKGSQIYLEGKIQYRKYQDKQGVEKYITEIIGQTMKFLGSNNNNQQNNQQSYQQNVQQAVNNTQKVFNAAHVDDDSDLPF